MMRKIRLSALVIATCASIGIVSIVILGYTFSLEWTGLTGEVKYKTLWDWLDLIIVPLVLAIAAFGLGRLEARIAAEAETERRRTAVETEHRRAENDRELEQERTQQTIFETYLDRMSELLLRDGDNPLGSRETQDLAFVRTITALRRLDFKRREMVIAFLRDARLLGAKKRDARFEGRDLYSQKLVKAVLEDDPVALFKGRVLTDFDFRNMDLSNVDFSGSFLTNTDFRGTNLANTQLAETDLSGARFEDAQILATDFSQSNMTEADFTKCRLQGVNMVASKLENAEMNGAVFVRLLGVYNTLDKANLSKATLSDARILDATCYDVTFDGAKMANVHAENTIFWGSTFRQTDLKGAVLSETNFYGASFSGADLSNATLRGTRLCGTTFYQANLESADFEDAILGRYKNEKKPLPPANFVRAKNLTCEQLVAAKDWQIAARDESLACGADIPTDVS